MNIQWYISPGEVERFANSCEAVIRSVGRGTRTATEAACKDILAASLEQVPRDTGTLASTAFYEVSQRAALKGYVYEGTVGYAGVVGAGVTRDAINPKTGKTASTYATVVHEDLDAWHYNGKAKFLEDPVRAYGERNFSRVAETHWKWAIELSDFGGSSFIPRGG